MENKHTPEVRCSYCGPDGTIWNGDSSKICPHCNGSGFQLPIAQSEIDRLIEENGANKIHIEELKSIEIHLHSEIDRLKEEKRNLEIWISAAHERLDSNDFEYINRSILTRIK